MKTLNLLILGTGAVLLGQTAHAQPLQHTLLAESRLIDDCLICGRPSIAVPMRGTFTLVPDQITPVFTRYRLENIAWVGGSGTNVQYDIRGSGTYTVGGEFAVTKRMVLNVTVNGSALVFTNDGLPSLRGFPDYVIDTSLSQTQQNLFTFYSMDLLATPLREVWFSTPRALPRAGPGDLLSTTGQTVKSNRDLVGRLGFMPVVPHMGIDAVEIAPGGGEVWFSLNERQFSESLGQINDGDIVASTGRIVRRYFTLIAPFFQPPPPTVPPDPGLDALHVFGDDGTIVFSVRSNFFSTALGRDVRHGDLLTDRGQIFKSNAQLLERFQPVVAKDYGLDAVYIWPSGEIWFSTAEGFSDQARGAIREGDILSDAGYIALRNEDLTRKFGGDNQQDYGADGLFVVTDLSVARRPRIAVLQRWLRLVWEGDGRVFQLEKATNLTGPFLPITQIIPDREWTDSLRENSPASGFYRVRQW